MNKNTNINCWIKRLLIILFFTILILILPKTKAYAAINLSSITTTGQLGEAIQYDKQGFFDLDVSDILKKTVGAGLGNIYNSDIRNKSTVCMDHNATIADYNTMTGNVNLAGVIDIDTRTGITTFYDEKGKAYTYRDQSGYMWKMAYLVYLVNKDTSNLNTTESKKALIFYWYNNFTSLITLDMYGISTQGYKINSGFINPDPYWTGFKSSFTKLNVDANYNKMNYQARIALGNNVAGGQQLAFMGAIEYPGGNTDLNIQKTDSDTGSALIDAEFIIAKNVSTEPLYIKGSESSGYTWTNNIDEAYHYKTDKLGKIRITNLPKTEEGQTTPIQYSAIEVKPPEGYTKAKENTNMTQTFNFGSALLITLDFKNKSDDNTGATIIKEDAYTGDVLEGAKFIIYQEINDDSSEIKTLYVKDIVNQGYIYEYEWTENRSEAKTFTTNQYGKINLYDLPETREVNGEEIYITYIAEEIEPPEGYKSSQDNYQKVTFNLKNEKNVTVTVTNIPDEFENELIIYKRDNISRENLAGVGFVIKRQFHLNQSVSDDGESLSENLVWKYLKVKSNGSYEWVTSKSSADVFYTDSTGRIVIKNLVVSESIYARANYSSSDNQYCSECSGWDILSIANGAPRWVDVYHCLLHHSSHSRGYHYIKQQVKVKYQVEEVSMPDDLYDNYSRNIGQKSEEFNLTPDASNDYITQITMNNTPNTPPKGNVKISGKVWVEGNPGNKSNDFNDEYNAGVDKLLSGIKVHWKDAQGNDIVDPKDTESNGEYIFAIDIDYEFCTWWMDSETYEKLNNSYIEFEYDGQKYTTVKNNNINSENTSRAIENYNAKDNSRYELDQAFCKVNNTGVYENDMSNSSITDFTVTADTSKIKNILSGRYYQIKTKDKYGCIYHTYRTVTNEDGSKSKVTVHHYDYRTTEWTIENMNLGLVLKEQPDLAIKTDIAQVDVIMKGQQYTYKYGHRGIETSDKCYQVSFGDKYAQTYKRPVNPSDIAYINKDGNNSEDLEVYVTYIIRVTNQSTTLYTQVKEIVNYYDKNLEIVQTGGNSSKTYWYADSQYGTYDGQIQTDAFKRAYNISLATDNNGSPIMLAPGASSETVSIKFKVNNQVLKDLIRKDALFKNVSEIYAYSSYYGENTICAEHTTASNRGRVKSRYSGLDRDSSPGNAIIRLIDNKLDYSTYEDDTDLAPTFMLMKDPEDKIISGNIFEDSQTKDSEGTNERLGNGIKDGQEQNVANVKVELLRVYDDGSTETAKLYTIDNNNEPHTEEAITWTNENGEYNFTGIVVDNYIIRYTYGGSSGENGESTLIMNQYPIDGRNYKSTIITQDPVKRIMQDNTNNKVEQSDLLWHLTTDVNVSTAVDNIDDLYWKYRTKEDALVNVNVNSINEETVQVDSSTTRILDEDARLQIESLINSNFNTPTNVSAYSLPFKVQVEYTKDQTQDVTEDGIRVNEGTFDHNWDRFNFGIIKRAKEDIVVDKTIDRIRISLANGQVLTEGDPYSGTLNYVRALGNTEIFDRDKFINSVAREKKVFMEMDSELIQGATLEILYKITVKNNSEEDVEYDRYDEMVKGDEKYYWYGEVERVGNKINKEKLIRQSVEYLVDYVDPDLTCEVGEGTQNVNWQKISAEDLRDNSDGYMEITEEVYNRIKRDEGNYLIFVTNKFKNIAAGERHSETLYVSKLLANQADEHVYENHAEIIQLNGKIARTIDITEKGEQTEKTYIPGNYVPSLNTRVTQVTNPATERLHEQDDDSITLTITPPTGLPNNIIIYIISGTIGLVIIGIGIYIIRRKII